VFRSAPLELALLETAEEAEPERTTFGTSQEAVVVARFREIDLAHVAEGKLLAVGLHPTLIDENMVALNWFAADAVGGAKLVVPESEAEAALDILSSMNDAIEDDETA
jgi:hypothetical protein